MVKVNVKLDDGTEFVLEAESYEKAKERSRAIVTVGLTVPEGNNLAWYPPNRINKILIENEVQ